MHYDNALLNRVVHWIFKNLQLQSPRRHNTRHTNYGLKHQAENDLQTYVSPDLFHQAMLIAGYTCRRMPNSSHYCYNIREDSPLFVR